jgi:carbamoyl-phosphate synthase/aspartate carbamoyltransferase
VWHKLDLIDAFSIGATPYRLALEVGETASPSSGMEETLPLLLTAVQDGRLSLDDIRVRLHDNPVHIFGLPDQTQTHVEVVIGRKARFGKRETCWSPLESKFATGAIHRVVVHGNTAFLDGSLFSVPLGKDISSATINHPPILGPVAPKEHESMANGNIMSLTSMPSMSASQSSIAFHATASGQLSSHTLAHPSFHRRHILSVKQFTHRDMYDLFSLANEMRLQVERNGTLDILKGRVLCTLFYEPSTRTSSSFDAAMKRCGGEVVQITADTSSVAKGESLPDTIRTLGCYGDAIVIRHPDVGSAQLAAKFSPVPIINAGDGIGEHPTQVRKVS